MPHKHIDGIPSVTEILDVINKPYLQYWRGKYGNAKCEKISKQSKAIGIRVHTEIERLFKGSGPKYKNKAIRKMVQNFNDSFVIPYQVKPMVIEPKEPFIDNENKYSGTFDAVIEVYSKSEDASVLVIADWKTSNQIDKTWGLQLAAYANLYNLSQKHLSNLLGINEGLVIRLDKKTLEIEGPIWYTNLDQYFEVFLSCRRLYDFVNKKGIWEKQ